MQEEVAERDLRGDAVGRGVPAANGGALGIGLELLLDPLDQVVDQQRVALARGDLLLLPGDHAMEDVVVGVEAVAAVGVDQLGHQLAAAGDVRHPLLAADLQRGRPVELRRGEPVGERPHVLGRHPVGAHQRHFLQLLAPGHVDDGPVGAPLHGPLLQAELGQLADLGQEVGLEEDPVEVDAEPGERLALAGDRPGARLRPQLERRLVAVQHPLQQLVGGIVAHVDLARQRVGGVVLGETERGAAAGAVLDVVGVAVADEMIALHPAAVLRALRVAAAAHDPGHRLAHAAADVADDAAPLDLAAGLRQRVAERVAERQVAHVADVQRLGRVGVPEVEREGAPGGDVAAARNRIGALLQGGSAARDPLVVEAQPDLLLAALDRRDPGVGLDLLQRRERRSVLAPALCQRHQHQVEALVRPVGGAQGPVRLGAVAARHLVEAVEEIDVHNPDATRRRCTSRGSNPDPRLTNPIL